MDRKKNIFIKGFQSIFKKINGNVENSNSIDYCMTSEDS